MNLGHLDGPTTVTRYLSEVRRSRRDRFGQRSSSNHDRERVKQKIANLNQGTVTNYAERNCGVIVLPNRIAGVRDQTHGTNVHDTFLVSNGGLVLLGCALYSRISFVVVHCDSACVYGRPRSDLVCIHAVAAVRFSSTSRQS